MWRGDRISPAISVLDPARPVYCTRSNINTSTFLRLTSIRFVPLSTLPVSTPFLTMLMGHSSPLPIRPQRVCTMDTVTLQPNSLYVCLQMLLSDGFHWVLLSVDASSQVESHQWSQSTSRPQAGQPIEVYNHACISVDGVVPTYTENNTCNLAYLRIQGYTASHDNTFDFASAFSAIFPTSYDNIRDNRHNRISCRTWVRQAMQVLRDAHILVRVDTAIELEEAITAAGKRIEPLAATAGFVAVVENM